MSRSRHETAGSFHQRETPAAEAEEVAAAAGWLATEPTRGAAGDAAGHPGSAADLSTEARPK